VLRGKVQRDLIFDIGMHNGDDTAFYLAKDFRVVAIEASPTFGEIAQKRFPSEIANGRLTLVNKAIWLKKGTLMLDAPKGNEEWASTSRTEWEQGREITKVAVETVAFEDILAAHGTPYYMKVDIEGSERYVLEGLHVSGERPSFVSFEAGDSGTLSHLYALGYRRFKIVDQAKHSSIVLPNPPLEGKYVPQTFGDYHSGPFGNESPGPWLPFAEAMATMIDMIKTERLTWHDIHAARPRGLFG
jgi:FkbM family methyltransferase